MKPDDFQYLLDKAREPLLAGDFGLALSLYEKLARLYPGAATVWY